MSSVNYAEIEVSYICVCFTVCVQISDCSIRVFLVYCIVTMVFFVFITFIMHMSYTYKINKKLKFKWWVGIERIQ